MKKNTIWHSFGFAFNGLKEVWKERNFKLHLVSVILVNLAGFYFNISINEWLVIWLLIGIVLSLEIINTAIEKLVDLVSPSYNTEAGKIKDLAAAAVLVSSIVALVVAIIIFLPYLY